jgi:hypothetical protein
MAVSTMTVSTSPCDAEALSVRGAGRCPTLRSRNSVDFARVANPPNDTMMCKNRRIAGGTFEPVTAGRTSKGCRVASPHTGKVE